MTVLALDRRICRTNHKTSKLGDGGTQRQKRHITACSMIVLANQVLACAEGAALRGRTVDMAQLHVWARKSKTPAQQITHFRLKHKISASTFGVQAEGKGLRTQTGRGSPQWPQRPSQPVPHRVHSTQRVHPFPSRSLTREGPQTKCAASGSSDDDHCGARPVQASLNSSPCTFTGAHVATTIFRSRSRRAEPASAAQGLVS